MPTRQEELLAIEEGFWAGDAEYYRQNLADRCLIVFTEMAGAFGKEEIAGMMKEGRRWRDLALEPKGTLDVTPEMTLLTYEARATREDGEVYSALVSSGYVRTSGGWKMVFHQQTPIETGTK